MVYESLDWRSSAVVIWLPEGDTPSPKHFRSGVNLSPPNPNPEPWWELGDALSSIHNIDSTHDKKPWIKVGNIILKPSDINPAYKAYEANKAKNNGDT